jgi:hypothetical protein
VYSAFLERLVHEGEVAAHCFVPSCLGEKQNLINDCGNTAKNLLVDCEHVFICWDLYPAWQPKPARPCLKNDRDRIDASLKNAGVPSEAVSLICISRELEAWLIADGAAMIGAFWKPQRGAPPSISHENRPDNHIDPKKHLRRKFKTLGLGSKPHDYNAYYHAAKLADKASLERVAKSQSFCRLVCKLRKVAPGTKQELCACP